jgi:hypothetical protein
MVYPELEGEGQSKINRNFSTEEISIQFANLKLRFSICTFQHSIKSKFKMKIKIEIICAFEKYNSG